MDFGKTGQQRQFCSVAGQCSVYEEKTSRVGALDASSCNIPKRKAGTGPRKVMEGEHAACWNATL